MKFSEYFNLDLNQSQLDFVDVDPTRDTQLYLDPYALEIKQDAWSIGCGDCIKSFFQELLDAIRADDDGRCQQLISHLHEPEETYLGMSSDVPQGRGLAAHQGNQILEALRASQAAETGVLTDLAESSLFIDNIDRDKISDLTTNIVRGPLLDYTASQCALHEIENLQPYGGPPIWNAGQVRWEGKISSLPYINGRPVILVPKFAVRRQTSLSSQEFYNNHMIEFLREELQAQVSLVLALRGRRVTKKEVKERNPHSKGRLAEFARRYPELLEEYKRIKGAKGPLDTDEFDKDFDEREFARILQEQLPQIPVGRDAADQFHNFTIGLLTFLFYPSLVCPIKEAPINQGRKRIDIRFTNGLVTPFFERILQAPQTRAISVVVECKNYTDDIGNAELDQLAGRFSDARGWFGILFCRNVDDWDSVNARCLDLARDGHGFIVVMTDADVLEMLRLVRNNEREALDVLLTHKLQPLLR